MPKCYFAHPYNHRNDRDKFQILKHIHKRMSLAVIDPFDGEDKLLKKHGVEEYYKNPLHDLGCEMWLKDLNQIHRCQYLVAWIPDYEALGTSAEISYAYALQRVYIIIISPILHPSFALYHREMYLSVSDFLNGRKFDWKNEDFGLNDIKEEK